MKFELDRSTAVKINNSHNGFRYEVSAHNFNPEPASYGFRAMWATYLLLTEEQYAELKDKLHDAPWNGGITFQQKITQEHLDCPEHLKAKWNKPFYKIGDDFSHLWDSERGGWDENSRPYMESHIKRVIDYLAELSKEPGEKENGNE